MIVCKCIVKYEHNAQIGFAPICVIVSLVVPVIGRSHRQVGKHNPHYTAGALNEDIRVLTVSSWSVLSTVILVLLTQQIKKSLLKSLKLLYF